MATFFKNSWTTFTVTVASPAIFSATAHNLVEGDIIIFETTGALPTGITAGTPYYVIAAGIAADTFRISATEEGSAINTSSAGSGTHRVNRIAPLPKGYKEIQFRIESEGAVVTGLTFKERITRRPY